MPQAASGKPTAAGQTAQGGKGANKENEGESARPGGSKAYLAMQKAVPQPPTALNPRYASFASTCTVSLSNALKWQMQSPTAIHCIHFAASECAKTFIAQW